MNMFMGLKCCGCLPTRIVFAFVSFVALMLNWGLRSIPNLAVVAMVNYSAIPRSPGPKAFRGCVDPGSNKTESVLVSIHYGPMDSPNMTIVRRNLTVQEQERGNNKEDGSFVWDEEIQQLIISSFYWGYLFLQIPGGRWAEMYGGKRLVSISTFGSAAFTLLVPLAVKVGYGGFIATRVGMGLSQAVLYPAITVLIARWSPPAELSRMNTLVKTGAMFGVFVFTPTAGWLIASYGWESVFYIFGSIAIIWGVLWEFFVFDSPDRHPRISEKEQDFIRSSLGSHNFGDKEEMKTRQVPWKAILTSKPVWAATFGSALLGWSFVTLSSLMPTYMKVMLGFDIKTNGILNGVPYLGRVIFGLAYSWLVDFLLVKQFMNRTAIRKFSYAAPGILRAAGLLAMPYLGCDSVTTVAIFLGTIITAGAAWSSTGPCLVEMSPNFVGTVYGVFNTAFTVVAIVAPVVSASFIKGNQTFETWAHVFNLSAGLAVVAILIFCLFGSAEEQPWNRNGQGVEEITNEQQPSTSHKEQKV